LKDLASKKEKILAKAEELNMPVIKGEIQLEKWWRNVEPDSIWDLIEESLLYGNPDPNAENLIIAENNIPKTENRDPYRLECIDKDQCLASNYVGVGDETQMYWLNMPQAKRGPSRTCAFRNCQNLVPRKN